MSQESLFKEEQMGFHKELSDFNSLHIQICCDTVASQKKLPLIEQEDGVKTQLRGWLFAPLIKINTNYFLDLFFLVKTETF